MWVMGGHDQQRGHRAMLSEAIINGVPPCGGLYQPSALPPCDWLSWEDDLSLSSAAYRLLSLFFSEDPLLPEIEAICQQAFQSPIVLNQCEKNTGFLELFHGPTLSFKDFGAQFLSACMQRLKRKQQVILVATSGDTGSAVCSAFYRQPDCQVVVLYPRGMISKRQELQIATWGDNVLSLAVEGTFDDCQMLVKSAFQQAELFEHVQLSTANSMNLGRLLPQMVFYAYSSWQGYRQYGRALNYIVPSGNLGNITAAMWARQMGFPINRIYASCNANDSLCCYCDTGIVQAKATKRTIANAMDVGNPSNFPRLCAAIQVDGSPEFRAQSFDDASIRLAIQQAYDQQGYLLCPHTATAYAMRQLQPKNEPWVIVATAHPCKFDEILEPLLQLSIPVHPNLQPMLTKSLCCESIPVDLSILIKQLQTFIASPSDW